MSEAPEQSARIIAFQCIRQWRKNPNKYISERIDLVNASAQNKSLARELALGVVRFQRLYRHLIKSCLDKAGPDTELLDILSIAAHQIFMLDSIPDHAIGHSAVELTEQLGRKNWKPVVNVVVRKLLEMRSDDESKPRVATRYLPNSAAVALSFPDEFIRDLKKEFPKQWRKVATTLNTVVPLCTRTIGDHVLEVDKERLLHHDGKWLWWKQVQDAINGPVADDIAVVQDRSQAWLVDLAEIQKGELILDLCAAPGGKTRNAIEAKARVYSCDVLTSKMKSLKTINPSRVFVQDGRHAACRPVFDCVIVDVPCSNSGVFARKPEARWRYNKKTLLELSTLQQDLLKNAAGLVAPGGRLMYASCSIIKGENMDICESLPGWSVDAVHLAIPDRWQAGGFVARLIRSEAGNPDT